ncbi:MAG: RNA polymerase sigma factor [Bacteroidales bacterium]|jgi:RNA polymerase sigma-70 factor (ECF subfamily)|nr:RNA polymerase sigma factor [Bacteroidales bacterium]
MVKRTSKLSGMDDLTLRSLVLAGDEVASSCLFLRYQNEIKTFLVSRGCQSDDADDVTIMSLLKILKSLDTYDANSGASFRTWALTIAKHTYIDWCKMYNLQVAQLQGNDSMSVPDDATPETLLIEKERQAYFVSLLGQLSEYDQKILLMKGAGMKYEEIATELGISLQVVKNRIHQAKIKLVALSEDVRKD